MAVQINEVIVRAVITSDDSKPAEKESTGADANIASVTKQELLELIDEIITDKKER